MEKGLKLGPGAFRDTAALRKALKGFDWAYFGSEFCENLLEPGLADGLRLLAGEKKDVCLLTPLVTDKGLRVLEGLFSAIRKMRFGRRFEISVNDFGVLGLIRRMRWSVPVSFGRRLSRDFALPDRGGVLSILNRDGTVLLKELKVGRLEMTLFPGALRLRRPEGAGKLRFTVFYPYMDIATSRTCLMGMPDVPPGESPATVNCARECLRANYGIKNDRIRETLIAGGNTIFVEWGGGAASRSRSARIDRLVFCPDT
ncbi:MAG: hypothetical protein FD189_235 [Elusimicrobia bacterium]|nr:MAG: hypothetical protein FD154_35 [Elusimicrobiota bacterium]KAF0157968.1 MAG: hypothetical protein FD189_235 [Elusimicrobiota bacterium]